jgi:galactokinase
VRALRDVSIKQLEDAQPQLSEVVFRRCRHVVAENARTTEAAKMLGRREYERVGELMIQSHASLRDEYEVSCPELDYLAAEAMKVKGVYGARMTGAGFGGCIVALAQPRAVQPLIEHLQGSYRQAFNIKPAAFVTSATAGAQIVE